MKQIFKKLKSPEVLIPAVATALVAVLGWLLVENAYTVMRGDAVALWDMAQVPIDPKMSWTWDGVAGSNVPYTYRIAVPFVVRNLFGSSMAGFIFIAIASLFVCNYFVYRISQLYAKTTLTNSLIVIIFATNFTIFNTLVNPALVDLPSFALALTMTYLFLKYIAKGASTSRTVWITFSFLLLIAVMIKEWVLFILPAFFLYLVVIKQYKKAMLLFLYSLPAVGVHLAIRLIMGPLFPELQQPSLSLLVERYFTEIGAYRSLFATFGAIWIVIPLALYFVRRNKEKVRETYILFFIGVAVWLVMGTIASDHNRYLFFLAFPLLIPALSLYFTKYSQHLKRGALFTIIALLAITRMAMHFRPESQNGSVLMEFQSEGVIAFISAAAAVQILVILYYVLAVHRKIPLPGAIPPPKNKEL